MNNELKLIMEDLRRMGSDTKTTAAKPSSAPSRPKDTGISAVNRIQQRKTLLAPKKTPTSTPKPKPKSKRFDELPSDLQFDVDRQVAIAYMMRHQIRVDLPIDLFVMLFGHGLVMQAIMQANRLTSEAWRPDSDYLLDLMDVTMNMIVDETLKMEPVPTPRDPFGPLLQMAVRMCFRRIHKILEEEPLKFTGANGRGGGEDKTPLTLWKVVQYTFFLFALISTVHIGVDAGVRFATDSPVSRTTQVAYSTTMGAYGTVVGAYNFMFSQKPPADVPDMTPADWEEWGRNSVLSMMRMMTGEMYDPVIFHGWSLDVPGYGEMKLLTMEDKKDVDNALAHYVPENSDEESYVWTALAFPYRAAAASADLAYRTATGTYSTVTSFPSDMTVYLAHLQGMRVESPEEAREALLRFQADAERTRFLTDLFNTYLPSYTRITNQNAAGIFQNLFLGGPTHSMPNPNWLMSLWAHMRPFIVDLIRFPSLGIDPLGGGRAPRMGRNHAYMSDFSYFVVFLWAYMYGKGFVWNNIIAPYGALTMDNGIMTIKEGGEGWWDRFTGSIRDRSARMWGMRIKKIKEGKFYTPTEKGLREMSLEELREDAEKAQERLDNAERVALVTKSGSPLSESPGSKKEKEKEPEDQDRDQIEIP